MPDMVWNYGKLLTKELGAAIKTIHEMTQAAYLMADRMGSNGGTGRCLMGAFEHERLADAQGLAMQDTSFQWAKNYSHLTARLEENSRGRPHTVIETPRLLMTVHRVRQPGKFPQEAIYRQTCARSNQLTLLPMNECCGIKAYVFLLHGPAIENIFEPGFLQLAMPAPAGRKFLAITDLFKSREFGDKAPVELIESTAIVRLKNVMRAAK